MWGTGILNGLRITMRNLLRGPITVDYPYERLELPDRARWAVTPIYDASGAPKCTACMACVRACPDHVLALETAARPDKTKHIERFSYEIGACMMCGLCVEACPFDAIEMGHDYELARTSREQLAYDLLSDVDAAPIKPRARSGEQEAVEDVSAKGSAAAEREAPAKREEAADE